MMAKRKRGRPAKYTHGAIPHGTIYGYQGLGCRCRECACAAMENQTRARAKRYGVERERYSRIAVYEDDPTCHICGEFVEWEDFTVDHIVPMSLGGPDRRDNVATAHFRCNSAKGAKDPDVAEPTEPTEVTATYPGQCAGCGTRVERGEQVIWTPADRTIRHLGCLTHLPTPLA
jgi:hypothetical protein